MRHQIIVVLACSAMVPCFFQAAVAGPVDAGEFARAAETSPDASRQAQGPSVVDPERLALARQVMVAIGVRQRFAPAVGAFWSDAMHFSGRTAEADESAHRVKTSLVSAADAFAPKFEEGSAVIFARSFTADQLRDLIVFLRSNDGRIAVQRRPTLRMDDEATLTTEWFTTVAEFSRTPTGKVFAQRELDIRRQSTELVAAYSEIIFRRFWKSYCPTGTCVGEFDVQGLHETIVPLLHWARGGHDGSEIAAMMDVRQAGNSEHEVAEMTAAEWFTDPRIAALARAACIGDLDGINRARDEGADVNAQGNSGNTPLLWSIDCENLQGITALLVAGADVNRVSGGTTPVYVAAEMRNPDVLRLLLKHGGDPNSVSPAGAGRTALEAALRRGVETQGALLANVRREAASSDRANSKLNTLGAVEQALRSNEGWKNWYILLDAGAKIDQPTKSGSTIAEELLVFGCYDKVSELLERGFNLDLQRLADEVTRRQVDPQGPLAGPRDKVIALLERVGVHGTLPPDGPKPTAR